MTTNWNEMTARERDAVVMEKAAGYKRLKTPDVGEHEFFVHPTDGVFVLDHGNYIKTCKPTERIQDAWLVVERMREKGWHMDLDSRANQAWYCRFMSDGPDCDAAAATAPEAICLAALRALGVVE